jgi:hypothetical protein
LWSISNRKATRNRKQYFLYGDFVNIILLLMLQMSDASVQTRSVKPNSVCAGWAHCFGRNISIQCNGCLCISVCMATKTFGKYRY